MLLTSGSKSYSKELPLLYYQVISDYCDYYAPSRLVQPAIGLTLAGLFANTHLDQNLQNTWQDHLSCPSLNAFSNHVDSYSELTQIPIVISFYLAAMTLEGLPSANHTFKNISIWGNHALRTLILGSPQQATLSWFLGSGRPQTIQPQWHLLRHHRAVSGHAFYGAIPLLNAAKLSTEPWIVGSLYLASLLPGLARINLNKHYTSQAFLGWWLALCATNTIWKKDKVSNKPYSIRVEPYRTQDGIILGLVAKF